MEPQHLHRLFDDQSPIESAAPAPRTPKRFATSNTTEMWVKISGSPPLWEVASLLAVVGRVQRPSVFTAASKLADGESGGKPRALQGTLGSVLTLRPPGYKITQPTLSLSHSSPFISPVLLAN
jgi:hypothetical protein